jgi:hypothetical protein
MNFHILFLFITPDGNLTDKKKLSFFFSLKIISKINAPNHQQLPRPPHATSELYQIMLQCWKYEPSERPTFSELGKTLEEV